MKSGYPHADLQPDILDCLTQTDSCFNLLLPRFDIPDLYNSSTCENQPEFSVGCKSTSSDLDISSKKNRTVSNTSFASVSSTSDGESETVLEVNKQNELNGNEELADVGTHTHSSLNRSENEEQAILASVYGTTSATVCNKDLKLSVREIKGKEKLTRDDNFAAPDSMCGNEEAESSDSDVEWEDVESIILQGTELEQAEEYLQLQQHGYASHSFSIPVKVTSQFEVEENEDNSNILATLKECKQMLTVTYLPTIIKWMEVRPVILS